MSDVEYTEDDGRVEIWLNRPDRMNATTERVEKELTAAIERGTADGRVIIISGRGEAFCAGFDFTEPAMTSNMAFDEIKRAVTAFQDRTVAIRESTVPVIARVNGAAVGGGCDLALACDFRIAATDALFREPFTSIGGVPADGGTYLLPRLVGEQTTKELMLLGRDITGTEAAEIGLVNDAVPADELDATVDEYVESLLSKAPTAMGQMKRLINTSLGQAQAAHFADIVSAQSVCLNSGELDEATAAFQEGREPDFSATSDQ